MASGDEPALTCRSIRPVDVHIQQRSGQIFGASTRQTRGARPGTKTRRPIHNKAAQGEVAAVQEQQQKNENENENENGSSRASARARRKRTRTRTRTRPSPRTSTRMREHSGHRPCSADYAHLHRRGPHITQQNLGLGWDVWRVERRTPPCTLFFSWYRPRPRQHQT
eukprot:2807960-Rhodomonas_salina.5